MSFYTNVNANITPINLIVIALTNIGFTISENRNGWIEGRNDKNSITVFVDTDSIEQTQKAISLISVICDSSTLSEGLNKVLPLDTFFDLGDKQLIIKANGINFVIYE